MIDCFDREIWDGAPREVELVYRVIQWGAGNNAQALIRAVHQHPDLELVGCRVWSEEKDGIDVGVLAGIGPIGISATSDAQSLVDTDADVVLFLPAMLPDTTESDREAVELLRSGKSVISLTGDHSMPAAAGNGFGEAVEEACRIGDSTFTAAGVNPGFIAERLAPTLTGLCADVTAVTIAETYDCSNSTAALLFDTMGFGLELKDWSPESPFAQMFNRAFRQVIYNMAATFDIDLVDVKWSCEVIPAHRDISVAGRVVSQGTVAAISQVWESVPKDSDSIALKKVTQWACSDDIPSVPVSRGWRVTITGKPNLVLNLETDPDDGTQFYAENMVGAGIPMIPEVIKAAPGILLPKIQAPFRRRFTG